MDTQPETPAAEPDRPKWAPKFDVGDWLPTEVEQEALDTLACAVGSFLAPGYWRTFTTEDGVRIVSLNLDLPFFAREDCIGDLVERRGGGCWQTGGDPDDDDPEAEADTLPALAKKLSALWAGPGRWTLARKQIAREAAEQAAEEAEQAAEQVA